MTDFDYKKYSLEKLETWVRDAVSSAEASPHEIYETITKVVKDEYYYFKNQTSRLYELLSLLNGFGKSQYESISDPDLWDTIKDREYYEGWDYKLTCDKDDKSPECQKAWNDFWEENYYPEEHSQYSKETVDDGMRPWGHSDLEYLANSVLTEDRISNFPGEQYSEEELNAMCDKAASQQEKETCREYNLREAEYYDKRAKLDAEQDKVVKWQLPVEVDGLTGDCFIQFPDDLLEAANLKEGDQVEWVDLKNGNYELRKVNGTK